MKPLRIGLAGVGTVGGGLLKLIQGPTPKVGGGLLQVAAVSARNRTRKRDVDISSYTWFDDPVELAESADIDVFVELIGGSDGPAKRAVEVALKRGVHVVTGNKALLAIHGAELAQLSEAHGGKLAFEAAVAGGVPIVKAMRESLAAAQVSALSGILNGTCNYILTEMEALADRGRQAPEDAFAAVLADAQRLGYAEADPTADVGGFDAAHKITLLAAIAFGTKPDFDHVKIEGIEHVTLHDIRLAEKLGYRIKLIAKAQRVNGDIAMHVRPCLLGFDHPLAPISGTLNAMVVEAEPTGQLTFIGRGAGAGPTAAAVAADLLDLLNGRAGHAFGRPIASLASPGRAMPPERSRYYMRALVADRPGVIADVAEQLGRENVSIESFLQMPAGEAPVVPIVLTTQPCARAAIDAASRGIESLDAVTEPPRVMPIEEDGDRPRFWS